MASVQVTSLISYARKCTLISVLFAGACLSQTNWIVQDTFPADTNFYIGRLRTISYSNSKFVATGSNTYKDTLITSSDGIAWLKNYANSSHKVNAVGKGLYISLDSGSIFTSLDTMLWTKRELDIPQCSVNQVVFGSDKFIAIATININTNYDTCIVLSSPDGITWTRDRNVVIDNNGGHQLDMLYAAGKFVMLYQTTPYWFQGSQGQYQIYPTYVLLSQDGVTWASNGILGLGKRGSLNSFSYCGNMFVAVGYDGIIVTSPDGVAWTSPNSATSTKLNSLCYGAGSYVAVGYNGVIVSSPNCTLWTVGSSVTTDELVDITYDDNRFVAVGGRSNDLSSSIVYSLDGTSWIYKTSSFKPFSERFSASYSAIPNQYMAAVEGKIYTSVDAATWLCKNSDYGNNIYSVAFGMNMYAAAGLGRILTSQNSTSWVSVSNTLTREQFYSIICSNNLFVAVGSGGSIFCSNNGSMWNPIMATNKTLYNVFYDNNKYVAVGTGGAILVSSNGSSWSTMSSGTQKALYSGAFGAGQFVVVGDSGTVLTSSTGSTWAGKSSGTSKRLYSIVFGNGQFVAVGDSGTILTSTNGTTWVNKSSGTNDVIYSIAYGNNKFIAITSNRMVLSSAVDNATAAKQDLNVVNRGNFDIKFVGHNISIILPTHMNNCKLSMKIYNIAGQTIYSSSLLTINTNLNIPTLGFPAGKYHLSIKSDNSTIKTSFVLVN